MTGGHFDRAVALVLELEGGFGDDPHDAGGATKYGISQAAYPHLDIRSLTLAAAKAIYRRDYWDRYRCGELPWPLALVFFDGVVQFSPARPIRWMQAAVGATVDGMMGPATVAAANACADLEAAARTIMTARGEYRTTRPNYPRFGKGWRARDRRVLAEAIG